MHHCLRDRCLLMPVHIAVGRSRDNGTPSLHLCGHVVRSATWENARFCDVWWVVAPSVLTRTLAQSGCGCVLFRGLS